MGLDMYAFSLDRSAAIATPRDVLKYRAPRSGKELPEGFLVLDGPGPGYDLGAEFLDSKYVLPGSALLQQWRKHPALHGWMERHWRSMQWHKGGKKAFNKTERVPLDVQALDALEHAVRHGLLPKTDGFFFGESEGTEQAEDLAFIAAARAELAAGKFVYYTSWW